MFEYNLKGKRVLLSIDTEFIPYLKPYGIAGSPILVKVFKMEEGGLWVETSSFQMSPKGVPKIYAPSGEAICRAHIFIPSKAVVSAVVFPGAVPRLEKDPAVHQIGFKARKKKRRVMGG